MIYEVRVHLLLKNEGIARGLFSHCEGAFPLAVTINPGEQNAEVSVIELIENHHDESPTAPCLVLKGTSTLP